MGDIVNLKIDNVDIVLKANGKHFLSEIVLTIPGSINETTGEAHKISKFISDIFLMNYSPSCDVEKCEVHENNDDENEIGDKKRPTTLCKIFQTHCSVRKTVNDLSELQTQLNQDRFLNYSDAVSSFADGLRVKSEIEKFNNYFKVIECIFMTKRKGIRDKLKKSPQLTALIDASKGSIDKDAYTIIDELVDIRDECSHLKPRSPLPIGYTSNNSDNIKKIKLYLPLLETICRELLKI